MIYLDNCATTRIYADALKVYNDYSIENFYNSAALYNAADIVLSDINRAREKVAAGLAAPPKDLIFTSGGTESNNLAIQGFLAGQKRGRIICGGGEHDSVYNVFKHFENGGFDVQFAPLDSFGAVDKEKLYELITLETILVSVMHVSNETGAINDIAEITKNIKVRATACVVHSDGVQAYGKINIDVRKLGCDLYSISAHKHHGPKGAGALYIAPHIKLKPLFHGGGHENNLRSGTHNAPSLVAYGAAAEMTIQKLNANYVHFQALKEHLWTTLSGEVVDIRLNSDNTICNAPHILSVSFKNIPAEVLVTILETKGIIIGTGAACSSKKGYSRIHKAMNLRKDFAGGTVRFSFSEFNTIEEIDIAARETINAVKELRKVCKR